MHLIVGLGNPEPQYKWTRHNIGFETINKLAYDHGIDVSKRKHKAIIGEGRIGHNKVMLAKPQTYMNLSGESVRAIIDFHKIPLEKIIIVYDEIAIEVGEIRIKERGSAGGHNGVKSLIANLNTDEFLRVRIGIGSKPPRMSLSDYVLSKFLPQEHDDIIAAVSKATEAIEYCLKETPQNAMNVYNVRRKASE